MPSKAEAAARSRRTRESISATQYSAERLGRVRGTRAILGTPDGSQVHCLVEQFSEAGAYLLRARSTKARRPLRTGDHVAVHLIPGTGLAPNSCIIDATIIRVEENGPGLAVRFQPAPQDDDSPYNDLSSDDWMTEVPEFSAPSRDDQSIAFDFSAFSVPESAANTAPSSSVSLSTVLRYTLLVGCISSLVAMLILFGDWLGAVVL